MRTPGLGRILRHNEALRREVEQLRAAAAASFVEPGHFYSPIPSLPYVREHADRIFREPSRTLPGVDLREREQLALLDVLQPYYDTLRFPKHKAAGFRYFYENPAYGYSDAIFLHCMIRHLRPRRIIEVGSGYSSCVTLDTNDRYFRGEIVCTFVEPYPQLLESLLAPGDLDSIEIIPRDTQTVSLETFDRLGENDILFIDSTHVSKVGSDVNYLFFEVLPRLAPGVYVHVHDVFRDFEYPAEWVYEGRAWTEAYMLRNFLAFNSAFEIVLFNTFLEHFHAARFRERMPLCLENTGGSIWLRRRR
jgi:predicted O-methyltransferase YrrM